MKESINNKTVALSSKYVISKVSPIVYATLHQDGVWEFWGKEIIDEKEIMVVTLEQIIQIDPSVADIVNMSVGFAAVRTSAGDKWEIISKN